MQSRLGPMDPGGFHGWYQLVGDGIKFIQKEDIMPAEADRAVFALAPAIVVMSTFLVFVVIPAGPRLVVAPLDVGVFYALAVSSLSRHRRADGGVGERQQVRAASARCAPPRSSSPTSSRSCSPSSASSIQAGTMNLQGIVEFQRDGEIFGFGGIGLPFILTQFVGFALFMVAAQAELTQPPFDMPVAESRARRRLHGRVHGLPVPVLLHRRVRHRVRVRGARGDDVPRRLVDPVRSDDDRCSPTSLGPLVLFAKVMLVAFLMFWARFTYPRFREDQLQALAWKWLIPIALVNILVTGVLKVAF